MDNSTSRQSGWVTFAALLVITAGLFHVLSGAAAIDGSESVTAQVKEVLYNIDIEDWGWFWVITGSLQLITGIFLFSRSLIAAVTVITMSFVAATLTIFLIFVAPLWAITVLTLNVGVIWMVTANMDEFGGTDIP